MRTHRNIKDDGDGGNEDEDNDGERPVDLRV